MKSSFSKFLFMISVFSIALIILINFLYQRITVSGFPPLSHLVSLIVFFLMTASSVHYVLLNAAQKRPGRFVTWFMGATVFKLFIYLGLIAVYVMLWRSTAKFFVVCFVLMYGLFTILEVASIIHHIRSELNSKEQ